MNPITVSVCVFTYNYEKFLAQAIDSILSQKTSFDFEILICDDCSTDNTLTIANNYLKDHPNKIKVLSNSINQGGTKNWIRAIRACSGKYIALIDGDDYFSSPNKLQKQFDILESNEHYVLCFHSVDEKYDDAPELNKHVEFQKEIYTLADFMENGWFVRTSSTFFKNGVIPKEIPEWVHEYPYRFDTILHVLLCLHGDAYNIKENLSVWRKHKKGMSFWLMRDFVKNAKQKISLSMQLNAYTNNQYNKQSKRFQNNEKTILLFYLLRHFKMWKYPLVFIDCLLHINVSMFFKFFKGKHHGIKSA
jgi:glycosyltransferase involved in cell wall biosynthesis